MNALHLPMRNVARSLTLLVLLVALPAAAQGLKPGGAQAAPLPPAAVPALPVTSTRGAPVREGLLLRAPAELAGGLAGGAMGAAGGAGAGLLLALPLCGLTGLGRGDHGKELCFTVSAIAGATAGGLVGMPLGVGWTGYGMGARGSAWGAAGGMLLSAAGAGAVYLAGGGEDAAAALLATAPLMAVVGYELTDRAPEARVSPTLALTPGGGSLGVQGRF